MAVETEKLKLCDGSLHRHFVVNMPKDGSCLFHALAHAMHGNNTCTSQIRSVLAHYISDNWERFGVFTCNSHGLAYPDHHTYLEDMLRLGTYGSSCELMAAAEIFHFTFEVFQDGELKARFQDNQGGPVKRLRFSGNDVYGHYDFLLPIETTVSEAGFAWNHEGEIEKQSEEVKRGRPSSKKKRGRPKISTSSRREQIREASARYRERHAEKSRASKAKYSKTHRDVNQMSVARYTEQHPEVNQRAVARYTEQHPEVNQRAVARYTEKHPEVHQHAVARYTEQHPEVHQHAVARYTEQHPEVHQRAVARYTEQHPEVNQRAVARYTEQHPEVNQLAVARYTEINAEARRVAAARYAAANPKVKKDAVARNRANAKLTFQGNIEYINTKVAEQVGDSVEAEKLVKWALYRRKVTVRNLIKRVETLKEKLVSRLESLESCNIDSGIKEKFHAFLGKCGHRNNQEPFYAEQSYKVYGDAHPIEVAKTGGAIFSEIETVGKGLVWACHDSVCALDEAKLKKLEDVFRRLQNQTPAQLYRMSTETEGVRTDIALMNTVKAHFPLMRSVVRQMYYVQSESELVQRIDQALQTVDIARIKEVGKQVEAGDIAVECETTGDIVEDIVIDEHKSAFLNYKKQCSDTPKLDCVSCNKLCSSKEVCNLDRLHKPLNTGVWKQIEEFYTASGITKGRHVCHSCLKKIRADQVPPASVINDLCSSKIPTEISDLNDYERILIQRAKAFQVVTSMIPVGKKHIPNRSLVKKVKGRTFHLPLPMEETLKKLPRPEDPLNNNAELYILVRGAPTKAKLIWEDLVDVKKVYAALSLLKRVNVHYSDIVLPGAPQDLLRGMDEDLRYIAHEAEDSQTKQDALLTQVTSEKEAEYEHYTIYPLHERRNNASVSSLYQMLKVNAAPMNTSDTALDEKCFPHLYVEGKFGQFHPRSQKLGSAEFIKARLKSKFAHFRLDQQYLFYLLNDANIRQLSSGIFYKMNAVNQKEKFTAERYLQMLNRDELEGDLTAIFGKLRNTEQFWRKPRNDLLCMTRHYGPATWFLTMSPSEWMWEDLGAYIKEVNGPEMSNKTTSELVALDPVSASRFIDLKFKAMLGFLTSPDGPVGKVTHYFWRREYQSRGAQHFHLMLWVEDAPVLDESNPEEVAEFISKNVTCAIPQESVSPTLHRRVVAYQTHRHNSYCLRKKKTKTGFTSVCRFGFPRPTTEEFILRDLTHSIAARRNLSANSRLYNIVRRKEWQMINDYNPAMLLAWDGNIDIQFIGEKTSVLNYYVTKYSTKGEKSHTLETFEDIHSSKSLRSRLYNIGLRALANRECGAMEASDTLLGIPLHGTDPQAAIRWLDVNIHRNRRVKSRAEMSLLDPESTDIYYESWIDNHYPERPSELEDMHLYDFSRNYDMSKTKPSTVDLEHYTLDGGRRYLRKRKRPYLINHYSYDVEKMPENYFFSLLLMFKPWRDLKVLKGGFETYTEAFHSGREELKEGLAYGELQAELQSNLKKAFETVEAKLAELRMEREKEQEVEGVDNPLGFEPLEAPQAMADFQRICSAEEQVANEDLDQMLGNLNVDQKRVFDMVTNKIVYGSEDATVLRCFVSGTGGTGKSYLIKALKLWVPKHTGKKVAVSAPTGIAAFNVNGLTIHRLLQLPVEHKGIPKYAPLSDQVLKVLRCDLKDVALFIIDEASMISNVTLAYIHLRLSEIFDTADEPDGWFGKRHILLLGDLLQLPPVREKSPFEKLSASEVNKLLGSLDAPNLWKQLFTYDELTLNMRQADDLSYASILGRIRTGNVTAEDRKVLSTRLIPLCSQQNEGRLQEISAYLSRLPEDTVCLLPTRNMCKQLNDAMLLTIMGPEITLLAEDNIDCAKHLSKRAHEGLEKYKDDPSMTAGLEDTITIKAGARVMLKRNIDVSLGLVNGSIGTVQCIRYDPEHCSRPTAVVIEFVNGPVYELESVKSKFEVVNRVYVHRRQFPISLAYAITIHKSQGLSLKNALIDIGSSVFSCGQAYVALSRVKSLEGLHLINLDCSNIKAQKSAIEEYNRLRSMHRPDLPKIEHFTTRRGKKTKDREWAVRACIANVQQQELDKNMRMTAKRTKKAPLQKRKPVAKRRTSRRACKTISKK